MHGHVLRLYVATNAGAFPKSDDGTDYDPNTRSNAPPNTRADNDPYVSAYHAGANARTNPGAVPSSDHESPERGAIACADTGADQPAFSVPSVVCTNHAPKPCAHTRANNVNPVIIANHSTSVVPAVDDCRPGVAQHLY